MGSNNSITVISGKEELIEQISAKLVLLRDLDKITSATPQNAIEFLSANVPNTVILHCHKNDPKILELIKKIKEEPVLKDIPILFLNDECSRETIIDAFDSGVSDIISYPAQDYELLIRIIWCIQKNEINTNIETRLEFMKQLGIIQPDTGVYTQKYCEDYLNSEFNNILKYKTSACLMLITPDTKYPGSKTAKEFLDIIKKSIRLNDSVAIKDVDEFYILLPKTKLNGVYPVFERINTNLGVDSGANAAVIEIKDQKFDDVKELLKNALNKAKQDTNALIVASSIYMKDPNAGINLTKQSLVMPMRDIKNAASKKIDISDDEKNNKIFKQAYKQKCRIVFEPVFDKYQNYICSKIKDASVNFEVTPDKTRFVMFKNNVRASLHITYGGLYKVKIDTALVHGENTKSTNSYVFDFVQLSFQKLSQIVEELYIEFKDYLKTSV